jgi:hypothetical protein
MGDFCSGFYHWTHVSTFIPLLTPLATGEFYTQISTNFSLSLTLVTSRNGNNAYQYVNNGCASNNKPLAVLTAYEPVATPPPLPSMPTSEHMQKELDGIFAWYQSSPSTTDLNQPKSNALGAPTSLKRGAPMTTSTAWHLIIKLPPIFSTNASKVSSDA